MHSKKLRYGLLSSCMAIGVIAATPAFAEGTAPDSWTGFYVGGQVGGNVSSRVDIQDSSVSSGNSDYWDNFSMSGTTGGIFGGYNIQKNNWVLGIEGDLETSDAKGNNPNWPFGTNNTIKLNSQGSIRGRIGYLVQPNALVYFTGGLAFGDVKADFYDGSSHDSNSEVTSGIAIGLGLEYAMTQNWLMRLDYRHVEFDPVTVETYTTDSGWKEHSSINVEVLRIGVAYKF